MEVKSAGGGESAWDMTDHMQRRFLRFSKAPWRFWENAVVWKDPDAVLSRLSLYFRENTYYVPRQVDLQTAWRENQRPRDWLQVNGVIVQLSQASAVSCPESHI
jgi:hypothetical protein